MTKAEAIDELEFWQGCQDQERAHGRADDVLCNLLRELGYGEVVDEWAKVERWYS